MPWVCTAHSGGAPSATERDNTPTSTSPHGEPPDASGVGVGGRPATTVALNSLASGTATVADGRTAVVAVAVAGASDRGVAEGGIGVSDSDLGAGAGAEGVSSTCPGVSDDRKDRSSG